MYRRFADAVKVPILANLTEFGKTPLFTADEIAGAGVGIALYPLSAFRAMNAAALNVYRTLRREGTQKPSWTKPLPGAALLFLVLSIVLMVTLR